MVTLVKQLQIAMPLNFSTFQITKNTGLIIVDEVNGFCTPGAGNLAPPVADPQIEQMVEVTVKTLQQFPNMPVLAFLDTHEPGVSEPPYPPHCERGTGEELLVPELKFLENDPRATLMEKDCINGFIGGVYATHTWNGGSHLDNTVIDWVKKNKIDQLIVVGICTDICVMDFVLTALSARNHMIDGQPYLPVKEIAVLVPGVSTYNLPKDVAISVGLPDFAAHPQDVTHYMGLYFMASRGAILTYSLMWEDNG